MNEKIRIHNWANTPLGPSDRWPQSLQTIVNLVLAMKHPAYVGWGANFHIIYNDAYAKLLGAKHPAALGQPILEVWPELRHQLEPLLAEIRAGNAVNNPDRPLTIKYTSSYPTGWFTGSWTPLISNTGTIEGLYCVILETPERVIAEQSLRESEARFRLIADSSPVPIYLNDTNARCIFFNRAYEKYFGLKADEATHDSWKQIIHPDDLERYINEYDTANREQRKFRTEIRISNSDKETRYIEVFCEPRFNEAGTYLGMTGICIDVTERANAEEALRQSRESFETVVNLVPDLIWSNEPDGNTYWYNQRWFDYTGQTPEEAAAYGWLRAIHPDDKERSLSVFKSAIDTGHALQQEHRIRNVQGQYQWFLVQAEPFFDENGKIVKWFGTAINIDARKQAEQQLQNLNAELEQQVADRVQDLQQSKELLKATLDSSSNMIQVFKAVKNPAGEIIDFIWVLNNNAAERIYGNVIGKSLLQQNPGVMPAGIFESFKQVTETGIPQHYEKHYVHEQFNGWFHQSVVKLNDGVATSTVNITESKRAEEDRYKSLTLLQQSEQSAVMGSWEYDILTGAFNWSDGMYHLFELPIGTKVNPETYLQYVTPASQPLVLKMIGSLTSGKTAFDEIIEFNINGNIKVFKTKATAIYNTNGRVVKLLGLDMDITASVQAQEKIRQMELEQQREVFKATLNTQEEERKRIAESLHNGLGQMLYGVKLNLDFVDPKRITAVETEQAFLSVKKLLGDCIKEARRISHELTPTVLEDYGLKEAVKDICRQLSGVVAFDCQFIGLTGKMDKYLEIAVYRIVQELMLNVIKHAQATQASTQIDVTPKSIVITVEDNGKGFDNTTNQNNGIGLLGIRNKVNLLNGKINITTLPNKGTTVMVKIPRK